MSSTDTVFHVVAGILTDASGRVLLAQRAHGSHLAGLWEFPGGKIEAGESAETALRRELHEELAIEIAAAEPLISIPWHYPEKSIVLHALRVREFRGTPHGQQQQQLRWDLPENMTGIPLPPPDRPIVTALRLPSHGHVALDAQANFVGVNRRSERVPRAGLEHRDALQPRKRVGTDEEHGARARGQVIAQPAARIECGDIGRCGFKDNRIGVCRADGLRDVCDGGVVCDPVADEIEGTRQQQRQIFVRPDHQHPRAGERCLYHDARARCNLRAHCYLRVSHS